VRLRFRPVETSFYDHFSASAQHLVVGAGLLAEMLTEGADKESVATQMREAEHAADETTHTIVKQVNSTFVTPFDREDIYALASGLDDVMDMMDEAVDMVLLYEPKVLPAALLIGLAFGAVAMALTTYMRSWQDFELVTLSTLPMFLFSATFFPVTTYPGVLRWVVEATPLYRGVVLCRELTTGVVTWDSAVSVVYLVAMGLAGLLVARRRLDSLLLT